MALGDFLFVFLVERKMVSWIIVFYCRMLIYASFLPTVILGGAHNEDFFYRAEQTINIARDYEDHEASKYCSQSVTNFVSAVLKSLPDSPLGHNN